MAAAQIEGKMLHAFDVTVLNILSSCHITSKGAYTWFRTVTCILKCNNAMAYAASKCVHPLKAIEVLSYRPIVFSALIVHKHDKTGHKL